MSGNLFYLVILTRNMLLMIILCTLWNYWSIHGICIRK